MGSPTDFFTGGFGGLAGGILGSIGSIWQNKTQLKIARETNAMNRQMFDDQLAYNTDMWNKQNEYNDPLAQRQRLENAGLNPLFFGLDGTGNASGWQSATPVPAQGAAVNNPLDPLSQGVGSMVDQQLKASQRNKVEAETEGQRLDNYIRNATKENEILTSGFVMENAFWDKKTSESEWSKSFYEANHIGDTFKHLNAETESILKGLDFQERETRCKEIMTELEQVVAKSNMDAQERQLTMDYMKVLLYGQQVRSQIKVNDSIVSFNLSAADLNKQQSKLVGYQATYQHNENLNYKTTKALQLQGLQIHNWSEKMQGYSSQQQGRYYSKKADYVVWENINGSINAAANVCGSVLSPIKVGGSTPAVSTPAATPSAPPYPYN